jgi:hypothetical protein
MGKASMVEFKFWGLRGREAAGSRVEWERLKI